MSKQGGFAALPLDLRTGRSIVRGGFPALACLALVSLSGPLPGANLVVNPGFNGNLNGWTASSNVTFDPTVDSTGTAGSGSARSTYAAASASTQLALFQCIAAGPGTYTLGGSVFIPNGQAVGGSGLITVTFFSVPTCTSGALGFTSLSTSTTGSFQVLSGPITAPAGTVAIFITGQNSAAAAGTHVVNFDDFVLDNGLPPSADLSITKSGPGVVTQNANVTYLITVSNAGPNDSSGVTVTDTIPGATSFVSATPSQGTCSGTATVTCSLGTVSNGSSATISLVLRVNSNGTVTNTATVTASTADPNPGNNSATTAGIPVTPLPSTWILLLTGLGMAGLYQLRRRLARTN